MAETQRVIALLHRAFGLISVAARHAGGVAPEIKDYLEQELADLHADLRRELGYEVRYTTAPEAYDGFGTVGQEVGTRDHKGQPWRRVEIAPEHYTWQTMRYRSGLHPALTPDDYQSLPGSLCQPLSQDPAL